MDTQKTLGQIIKEKRLLAGYSQTDVVNLMPFTFSQPIITRLEKEERKLSLEEAVYLAKVLGCTLEELADPFIKEAKGWAPDSEALEKLKIKKKIAKLQQELQTLKEARNAG